MIVARHLSRRSSELISHSQYCQHQWIYNFKINRSYAKKSYNYDLHSLIEWKKDTVRAFGSPRKSPKTGKTCKNGKVPNKDVINGLESFSAISARMSFSYDEDFHTGEVDTDISVHGRRSKNLSFINIPEYCFDNSIPLVDESILSMHTASGSSKDSFKKNMTEDGIYIPEIKPVPQTLNIKNRKVSFQLPINNQSKNHEPDKIMQMMRSVVPRKKKSIKAAQNNVAIENSNDLDLHQPPTPKGRKRTRSSTGSKEASKSTPFSSQFSCLPIEAPDSFTLITDFPLTFQNKDDLSQSLLDRVQNFKLDAEKIAFRTLPPVKTILNKTMPEMSRFFLNRWREGMIKELGEEGFKLHQEATIKKGINLHANIMEFLSGKPLSEIQIMPDNEGHWASFQSAMKFISNVYSIETDVLHPFLNYRGVFDCIARYKDSLCVVDWKTSKKPRPLLKNTYDDPLQIAAYVGAFNAMLAHENTAECDQINHGLIVVIYPDGSPAHIHMMNQSDSKDYWHEWTDRLYQYYVLMYTSKRSEGRSENVLSQSG